MKERTDEATATGWVPVITTTTTLVAIFAFREIAVAQCFAMPCVHEWRAVRAEVTSEPFGPQSTARSFANHFPNSIRA
jgi:hypothetical protein